MNAGLLDDTKSVLKSLIISSPHGMTVERLNRDYRDVEGRSIPYSALGYNKLETFLRSLTDTLVVTGVGLNAKITAISSNKTAHIDSMVTKQKNSTRKRARGTNMPNSNEDKRPPTPTHRPPLINLIQQPSHPINYQQQNSSYQQYQMAAHQSILQNRLQQQHHQHQQQQQQFIAQQNFMKNCYSLSNGTGISNLIHHPLFNQQPFNDWQRFQYSLQTRPQCQISYNVPPLSNRLQNALQQNQQHPAAQQHQQYSDRNSQHELQYHHQHQQQQQSSLAQNHERHSPQNIESHQSNIDLHQPVKSSSPEREKEKTETPPPTVVNGFGNYRDKFSSSASTFSSNKSKNSLNCDDRRRNDEASTPGDESGNMNVSSCFSFRTMNANNSHNNDTALNVSDSFLSNLNNNFKRLNLNSNMSFGEDKEKSAEAVPELQQNDIIFQLDYPADTVKYGEFIPDMELPMEIIDANWFGIFITEIHNPYKFWFHMFKENNELDILMQQIESTYTNLGLSELQLHKSCFKPGQVCCALYRSLWHRAQILDTPESGKVKVLFVDYGTVSQIPLHEVKYLLSDYSSLPRQALRGCLAHIRPVKHRWSRDATYAFLDMVTDLLLYAKAVEINYKDKIVTMVLTDTNKKVDFQINAAFIRKGHARPATSEQPSTNSTDSQATTIPRRRHFQESHPTFEMLENGEYPSFDELAILLSKGIDYEELQDQNIIPDLEEEIIKKHTDKSNGLASMKTGCSREKTRPMPRLPLDHSHPPKAVSIISQHANPFLNPSCDELKERINCNGFNETHDSNSTASENQSALDSKIKLDPSNPFFSDIEVQREPAVQQINTVCQPQPTESDFYYQFPIMTMPQPICSQSQQQTFYGHVPMSTPAYNPYSNYYLPPANNYSVSNPPPPVNNYSLSQPLPVNNYSLSQPPPANNYSISQPPPASNNYSLAPPSSNFAMNQMFGKMIMPQQKSFSRAPPGFENVAPKPKNIFQF